MCAITSKLRGRVVREKSNPTQPSYFVLWTSQWSHTNRVDGRQDVIGKLHEYTITPCSFKSRPYLLYAVTWLKNFIGDHHPSADLKVLLCVDFEPAVVLSSWHM